MNANKVVAALLGVATGDALGVPYEYRSREDMSKDPATGMVGYGTYHQPPGTWSDDSSLTFCLAESLLNGYDLADIAGRFIRWRDESYWTARGEVFDIGNTTFRAINRLKRILTTGEQGELKKLKSEGDEQENGNGSLMRILPLVVYIKGKEITEQFEITWEVSALTHRHIRAAMSCFIYLKLAEKILEGTDKISAYKEMREDTRHLWDRINFPEEERWHFRKVIQQDIREVPLDDLKTGGYVIEVLESAIWFFLNRENYKDTVLSIINLGHDTDTSAAIAGGLAGICYGQEEIPGEWLASLARKNEIIELGNKLFERYCI